jgi:hypothetical protein
MSEVKERTKTLLKKLKAGAKYSTHELCVLGEKRYSQIKDKVEPGMKGKFMSIEVDSGDYFIADDPIEASKKAKEKHLDSVFYLVRIGYHSLFRIKRGMNLL